MGRKRNASRQCVADGECRPPHHGSKDKRHYCRGKVGVEHVWRWMRLKDIPNEHYYARRSENIVRERVVCVVCMKLSHNTRDKCAHCGVVLSIYPPPPWMKVPEETHGSVVITRRAVVK